MPEWPDKEGVIAKTRRRVEARLAEHPDKLRAACILWAGMLVEVLREDNIRACIQAGSASWPRVRPEQDDGVCMTHFSYVYTPGNGNGLLSTAYAVLTGARPLPEMHAWVGIPARSEIIDPTTGMWPEQCKALTGMDWPGDKPPPYFWGTAEDLERYGPVQYKPHLAACRLADLIYHNAER